jgi:thiol:disulfide interchange protein
MSEKQENGALCFWLGFFLSLFGLLIAAIIGKGKGVIRAFQGMLLGALIVVMLLINLSIFGWYTIEVQETKQKNEAQATEQSRAEDIAQQKRTSELILQKESEQIVRDEKRRKRIAEIESEKTSLADKYRAMKRIADGLTGLRVDDPTRINAANETESIFKKGSSLTAEAKTLKDDLGK